MPLLKGKSRGVISENIREMRHSGYPEDVAVAASLRQARKSGARIPKKGAKKPIRSTDDTPDNPSAY